jgi:hypothetical protein
MANRAAPAAPHGPHPHHHDGRPGTAATLLLGGWLILRAPGGARLAAPLVHGARTPCWIASLHPKTAAVHHALGYVA